MSARRPAVAGLFYPADPVGLRSEIVRWLDDARIQQRVSAGDGIRGVIAPHAGYVYSGPIAASAYCRLEPLRSAVDRVVLMGPAHRVPVMGVATSPAASFATPLGDIDVDHVAQADLRGLSYVVEDEDAHALEHSIEVHLPFLQVVLDQFRIVPLVVGMAAASEVAEVLDRLWSVDTIVVVSTDLSHYWPYDEACRLDRRTARAIVDRRADAIGGEDACGAYPLRGLLTVADRRAMSVELVDLRNSGDTAGDRSNVVGYGAFVVR